MTGKPHKYYIIGNYYIKIVMLLYLLIILTTIGMVFANSEDYRLETKPADHVYIPGYETLDNYVTQEELNLRTKQVRNYWYFNIITLGLTLYFHHPTKRKFDKLGEKITEMIK